jgi:hypothetical protein
MSPLPCLSHPAGRGSTLCSCDPFVDRLFDFKRLYVPQSVGPLVSNPFSGSVTMFEASSLCVASSVEKLRNLPLCTSVSCMPQSGADN